MENDNFNRVNFKKLTLDGICSYARIISVYDGDTFTAGIPFKDDCYRFSFRILNIDAPEIKNDPGNAKKSRNRLIQLMGLSIELSEDLSRKELINMFMKEKILVWIKCGRFEKYGRVLCTVYDYTKQINLGDVLLQENLANLYNKH